MLRQHLRVLVVVAVIAAGLGMPLHPAASRSAVGPDGEQVIQIPIRWCALWGSGTAGTADNPDRPETDRIIMERMARATDAVWLNGARVIFRSAFTTPMATAAEVPRIADPASGPGVPGDILDPTIDPSELHAAVEDCRVAWEARAVELQTTLVGPIALNIGQFVDRSGTATVLGGWSGYTSWSPGTRACETPSGAKNTTGGFISVVDEEFTENAEIDGKLVAHELGHVLYLGHGNGMDDDSDTFYDLWCDQTESTTAPEPTLMHENIKKATHVLTERQEGSSRDLALVYTGNQIDPPAALVNGATLSDQRTDSIRDVSVGSVDLTYVELSVNESQQSVTLTQSLFGQVGEAETNEYLAFIDVDNNAETGGQPAELELPTLTAGVDLVTRVVVGPDRSVALTVWEARDGAFVDVTDSGVAAELLTPAGGESDQPTPIFDVVTVEIPLGTGGDIQQTVAIQTVARQVTDGQEFDVLPGENQPSDDSVELFLIPPVFPVCGLTPGQADAGDTVIVEATGFGAPGGDVVISLGDQVLATGLLDASGEVMSELTIPADTAPGLRLITVGIDGTALAANCALQIGDVNS